MDNKVKTYRWGRSRILAIPTMRLAVPAGIALSLGFGLAHVMLNNPDGPAKWLAGLIFGACLSPWMIALVAVLIVDRSTMPGAVQNPESSVESAWYDKAAVAAFHTGLGVCGVGAFVTTWLRLQTVSLTFVGVLVLLGSSFGIAYLVQKSRS